ncbi:MAG: hybrid sensor histidine kinase/response regulator [Proteobacteria bacterium]|nr:hybrid sensor histidine kinase/response regulator [Pseudomonadota bacterium]
MRILVVDDEMGIREGCRRALTSSGFEVEVAENGPSGLARLREGHYDVLLLDAMMPGMSGLEVLQHARKLSPDIICIIITGYATVELAVQAIREGAHDFVAKPFTAELLLQVINRELDRLRLRREAARAVTLEEENRELARVKAEMEKIAAIESRFMLTMVHILRAPVAVLQSYIQLIQKGYVPPDEQPALFDRAEQRAGELLTILDDVLMLSRLKEDLGIARSETVSVADVLEMVLASLKGQADQSRLTVFLEIDSRPSITAKADHIKALWINLLSNAIRYTPAGGRVTITLRTDASKKQIIGAVSDTGIGISTEEITRIFEEFYRTDAAKSMQETGTGLGLPIVQQVAAMYGGTIEIESTVNQGSTFRFTLPVTALPQQVII